MPEKVVRVYWVCSVCSAEYDTEEQARECEEVPAARLKKDIFQIGDKLVEQGRVRSVSGFLWTRSEEELDRQTNEIPIYQIVGESHRTLLKSSRFVRVHTYVLRLEAEEKTFSWRQLRDYFYVLSEEDSARLLRKILGPKRVRGVLSPKPPGRLERVTKVVDILISRATSQQDPQLS